jgi:hypothetical protein
MSKICLGSEVVGDDSILSEFSVALFTDVSKMNKMDTLHCNAATTSSSNLL